MYEPQGPNLRNVGADVDKRFVAVLIFAFFMATLASTTLYRLTANRSPARAALPTEKLVFASHDLEPSTVLREGDLVLTDRNTRQAVGGTQIGGLRPRSTTALFHAESRD